MSKVLQTLLDLRDNIVANIKSFFDFFGTKDLLLSKQLVQCTYIK